MLKTEFLVKRYKRDVTGEMNGFRLPLFLPFLVALHDGGGNALSAVFGKDFQAEQKAVLCPLFVKRSIGEKRIPKDGIAGVNTAQKTGYFSVDLVKGKQKVFRSGFYAFSNFFIAIGFIFRGADSLHCAENGDIFYFRTAKEVAPVVSHLYTPFKAFL